MKIVKLAFLLLVALVPSCIATFVEKNIPTPPQLSAAQYQNKPNAFIQVKWIFGNPNKFIKSDPEADAATKEGVSYFINKLELFNYYTFDKDQINNEDVIFNRDSTKQKKQIDYTVDIVVYSNYDKVWTDWVPITQLFSIGLVPVYWTQEFIVTLKVYDKDKNLIKSAQNNSIVTNWESWWALPLSFKYSRSDTIGYLIGNQIETLLQECIKENVFKYH